MPRRSLNFATNPSNGNNNVSVSKTRRVRKPPAGKNNFYALSRSAISSQRVWMSLLKSSFLILSKHMRLSLHSRQCSVTPTQPQAQALATHPHPHATVSLPILPNFLTNPYLHRHPGHPNPYLHNSSPLPFPPTAESPETSQNNTSSDVFRLSSRYP